MAFPVVVKISKLISFVGPGLKREGFARNAVQPQPSRRDIGTGSQFDASDTEYI